MNEDLTAKYRPNKFEEVLGQETVIDSLKKILSKDGKLPSCIIFHGPSGVGKTTLARVCANTVNCSPSNLVEIDAASKTGVDEMRSTTDLMSVRALGNGIRIVILDEAHRLSKQAWDSLLKSTEEPPPGNTWILCTTEPSKMPAALKTGRGHMYELKKVDAKKIKDLIVKVVETEKLGTDKKLIPYIAIKADGSPRQALTYLSMVRDMPEEQAKELIKSVGDISGSPALIEFCRVLSKQPNWNEAVEALKLVEDENETVRLTVLAYFQKAVMGEKRRDVLECHMKVLFAFAEKSFYPAEKKAPILVALARIIL